MVNLNTNLINAFSVNGQKANSRNDQLNAEVQKLNRDLKHGYYHGFLVLCHSLDSNFGLRYIAKLTLEANFTGDYSKLESSGRLEKCMFTTNTVDYNNY